MQWMMYEAAICTANSGYRGENRAHFLDGRYIPANEVALSRLYTNCGDLRDPDTLAR